MGVCGDTLGMSYTYIDFCEHYFKRYIGGNMENDIKKEARKQYFHYFRIWFIILGVTAVLALLVTAAGIFSNKAQRQNHEAETQRVFDYAEVLTDEEEQRLESFIAGCEAEYRFDIVVVTMNENVEEHGYWDTVMMNTADDIYDNGNYGFNRVHGDGILILDNWYEDENGSQKGTWLSTCGNVYVDFSTYDIDDVLDQVDRYIDSNPYDAYRAAIREACKIYDEHENGYTYSIPIVLIILGPIVIALIFAVTKLKQTPAKDTTTANLYVADGSRKMKQQADDYIRKTVTSTRINTGSSGGSGDRKSVV